jgi:hypothetical protein
MPARPFLDTLPRYFHGLAGRSCADPPGVVELLDGVEAVRDACITSAGRRHVRANLYVDGLTSPPEGCSCKRELDGADGFAFEEFGVGSDTEGF